MIAVGALALYATLAELQWLPTSAEIAPNGPPLRGADDWAFALPFQISNRSRSVELGYVTFRCMLENAELDGALIGPAYLSSDSIYIGPSETVEFRCPIDRMFGQRELRSATIFIDVSYDAPWPWPDSVRRTFTWDGALGEWVGGPIGR